MSPVLSLAFGVLCGKGDSTVELSRFAAGGTGWQFVEAELEIAGLFLCAVGANGGREVETEGSCNPFPIPLSKELSS